THGLRPLALGEVARQAHVDRHRPRPLGDRVRVPVAAPGWPAREGAEDRPCGAEEGGAQDEAGERPRTDQDGTAPFDRTRTAARRDGTRPARTTAARVTIRVRPTAPSGGVRITRFGKPKRGAKETTAWATTIPNA